MRPLLAGTIAALMLCTPQPAATPTAPTPSPSPSSTAQKPRADRSTVRLPAKWVRLAWCESRGRLHAVNNHTYYGLWQIHKGWFTPFGINPRTATMKQQYLVARHVYRTQGAKAWTCARKANFR